MSEIKTKIGRQAVVVIHGMGEQRPMETLRGFVRGLRSVMTSEAEMKSTLRSKPDGVGDIYETNRLSLDSAVDSSNGVIRPKTDFYEFYWAHNMRDTKLSHMLTWLNRLIFTWVGKVPPRLKTIWYTVWVLFVLAMAGAFYIPHSQQATALKTVLAPVLTAVFFPSLLSLFGAFAKSVFLNSAGDAARYFTPEPDNIAERSHIRQQGIAFLKKLHELKSVEKVDRIIIVAHSLGTVVAYDLLRLLWTEYNTVYSTTKAPSQPCLEELDRYYDEHSPRPAEKPKHQPNGFLDTLIELNKDTPDAVKVAEYQSAQNSCWQEQKQTGNPWLISDFITLGAAINAADYFMVSKEPMANLIRQREMPVSPPVKDEKDYSIYYHSAPAFIVDGKNYTAKLLNHGAVFGVTRWTNIYFSSDYVGGAMTRKFGQGIKDIEIPRRSPWFFPGGHTDYWNPDDKKNNGALRKILEAMQLDH